MNEWFKSLEKMGKLPEMSLEIPFPTMKHIWKGKMKVISEKSSFELEILRERNPGIL
jgi:hypothetical protein